MTWDGGGTFDRVHNFSADASAGIQAQAARFDAEFDGFKTGLENCVTLTGETTPTANQPMSGYRHTGVGAAVSADNYLRTDQFIKNTPIFLVGVSVNALTSMSASAPFGSIAPSDGLLWLIRTSGSGENFGVHPGSGFATSSINPSYIKMHGAAKRVIDPEGNNIRRGQWTSGEDKIVIFNASSDAYVLLNPSEGSSSVILVATAREAGGASAGTAVNSNWGLKKVRGGVRLKPLFDYGGPSAPLPVFSISVTASAISLVLPGTYSFKEQRVPFTLLDGDIPRLGELRVASGGSAKFVLFGGAVFSGTSCGFLQNSIFLETSAPGF